jgi:exonuclease SbcD
MEVIKGDLQAIEAAINESEAIALASQTHDENNTNSTPVANQKAVSEMNEAVSETDNAISPQDPVWLCIEVETEDYLTDLQQRIQGFLDGKNAEILQLKRKRKRTVNSLTEKQNVQLSELSVNDVFEARLALESIEDNPTSESAPTESAPTESAQETLLDDDQSTGTMKDAGSEKNAPRINRIRQLFNEAVEQVRTNDEEAEVSVEAPLANTTDNKGE